MVFLSILIVHLYGVSSLSFGSFCLNFMAFTLVDRSAGPSMEPDCSVMVYASSLEVLDLGEIIENFQNHKHVFIVKVISEKSLYLKGALDVMRSLWRTTGGVKISAMSKNNFLLTCWDIVWC